MSEQVQNGSGWSPYERPSEYGRGFLRPPPAASSEGRGRNDTWMYSSLDGRPSGVGTGGGALDSQGVDVIFKDVSIAIKHYRIVECLFRRKSQVLVRAATGVFARGAVHGIVALDEVNASALADALSGRTQPVEGNVWADGMPARVNVFREAVGVVRHVTWAFRDFTVEWNLRFALSMRRQGIDVDARARDVAQVLQLDLDAHVVRLSYAQQRRVDIAMELMAAPRVLVLHNPLYCLDCHARAEMMFYLQRVSRAFGTTVIATLPTLELGVYDRLHSVIILGNEGHTVFSGERLAMARYFMHRVQHPLHRVPTAVPLPVPIEGAGAYRGVSDPILSPADDNPTPDLRLGLRRQSTIAGPPDLRDPTFYSTASGGSSARMVPQQSSSSNTMSAGRAATAEDGVASDDVDLDGGESALDYVRLWGAARATDRYAAAFFDSSQRAALNRTISDLLVSAQGKDVTWLSDPASRPSVVRKTAWLFTANVRQRLVTIDWYVGVLALSVAVGLCMWLASAQSSDQQGMFNVRGIFFFMFIVTLQLNYAFITSYANDVRRFVHLKTNGVVSTTGQFLVNGAMMWLSRVLLLAPISLGVMLVISHSLYLVGFLGFVSTCHVAIVYLVVLFTRDPRPAMVVIGAIDSYMLLFSGFLVNTSVEPAKTFASLSLVRYGYGGAVRNYLLSQNYTCDGTGNQTSYCYTGQEYIDVAGFQKDTLAHTLQALGVCLGLLAIATFVRMHLMFK